MLLVFVCVNPLIMSTYYQKCVIDSLSLLSAMVYFLSAQPGGPPPKSNDVLGPLGLSWWMWVAVGVGGLVVVFLMVLVIALCRRIKRRKVSKDNYPGDLHMLLCRLKLEGEMKEVRLLEQPKNDMMFFFLP